MSLHTWHHQGPSNPRAVPPSWSTLMGRTATGEEKSCAYAWRVASVMSNSLQPCGMRPASLLCQRGSPGKNIGVYWPIQVAIPFQSNIFPAALAANSPEYLVLPEPLPPKKLHPPTHTRPSLGQAQVLQEQTPVDGPHAEVEMKPQWKPRAVWLSKKTQNLSTSCTSLRLNPHDQLGRLWVYKIYKRIVRAPTKENALVLIAVDIGGKNTQEQGQIRI